MHLCVYVLIFFEYLALKFNKSTFETFTHIQALFLDVFSGIEIFVNKVWRGGERHSGQFLRLCDKNILGIYRQSSIFV